MPVVRIVGKLKKQCRLHALRGVPLEAHVQRHGVRFKELRSVRRQHIGIVPDHIQGLLPGVMVHLHGHERPDPVLVQHLHQAAQTDLPAEDFPYFGSPFLADAAYLRQPERLVLQHFQRLVPEPVHDLPGFGRSHVFQRARRQIAEDGCGPRGQPAHHVVRLKLFSVGGMIFPAPGKFQFFSRRYARHAADAGDGLSRYVHPEDGVAVFRVLVDHRGRDALNGDPVVSVFHGHSSPLSRMIRSRSSAAYSNSSIFAASFIFFSSFSMASSRSRLVMRTPDSL